MQVHICSPFQLKAHALAGVVFLFALRMTAATNIPSACRIANIVLNDAMILSHDANPGRMEFSERTDTFAWQNRPSAKRNPRPKGESLTL